METFEDENPFDNDADRFHSATSSASKVNISDPPSPSSHPSPILPSSTPRQSRPFPSPGSNKQPQTTFKNEYCCARDRDLHSGDDFEILVCAFSFGFCLCHKSLFF